MSKEEVEKWAIEKGIYDKNIFRMFDPDKWNDFDVYMMIYRHREMSISGKIIMVKGDEIRLANDNEIIEMIKDDMFGDCGVDTGEPEQN